MKKIFALLLALSLVLCTAACGADKGGEELTSDVITVADNTAEESTEAPAESTEAAESTAVDESTTVEESTEETTEEETTEAAKKPETKEEIVEYFNTAVNGVKTNAKSATRNYSKISLAGSTTLPSALSGILRLLGGADKFLGDQLSKNSKGSETFTGSQIKNVYPVENESYASKLTAADVQTATCTEADGKYTITITTVPDGKSANIQHGQGHAPKAFNVVLPGVVNDNIPGVAASMVGTATMNYPSSKAVIVVDKETGNVLTANYDLYWTINFDKAGAILPFLTSDSWTIKY
ncbi:MAG: hypothetical protein IJK60_01205 [Clostridia bacterium]|nr:hypothetical protein [Clostridia bacterium]